MSLSRQTSFTESSSTTHNYIENNNMDIDINNNNINNIYQNTLMIDWLDIKWNIHDSVHRVLIRDINDNFVPLSLEQINTYAFPDVAIDRTTGEITHYPLNIYIPSCGCETYGFNCDSYTKVTCNTIYSDCSIMELFNYIHLEYYGKKVTANDLCKNDLYPQIKNAWTKVSNNEDVFLDEVMCNLTSFKNISKENNDYYLILKRNNITQKE